MKILHVIAGLAPRYGGPSKSCREMAVAVAQRGHEVSIFTTNQDGPDVLDVPLDRPVEEDGVEIRYFPIQSPRFWGTSWALAAELKRAIPEVDLVHIHSLYMFHDWVAGHYCQAAGIPYIIRPHGTLDPYLHRRHRWRKMIMETMFQHRSLRRAAAIHYTSEEEMHLAERYVCGAPGVVVPHGLNLEDYDKLPPPGAFRVRYPEIGDKTLVLFFGRLNFKKGLDILAKAFGELARARDDIHLVIAGPDDGMKDKTVRWLREEGVLEKTTFTGMVLGDEKLALLGDADIFVLPSYSENFGISVVEAMACGLPVVISDKVNIWREVEAWGTGKVTTCDAEATARAMLELLADRNTARRMGSRGKALVKEQFAWPRIALMLENVYTSLVQST